MKEFARETLKFPENYVNSNTEYPVPFVFSNNNSAKIQWSAKYNLFINQAQNNIDSIQKSLSSVDVSELSKKRLNLQLVAETEQLLQVKQLLSSFNFAEQTPNTQLSIQHRIPSQQHFSSYFKNIFRDWAWGEAENKIYAQLLSKIKVETGKILIIGGGAGRLLYDLAQLKPKIEIIQIDINPLLSFIGQKMCSGEKLQLTEIAHITNQLDQLATQHNLSAPKPIDNSNYQFLLGDILDHPFKDYSFDAIIAPWVIDILPENFSDFAKRINFLLKPEGELLTFGPLSFEKQNFLHKFTHEEVLEKLVEAGFSNHENQHLTVPYLQSPIETLQRNEVISFFYSTKIKNTKRPKNYNYYPDWMLNLQNKLSAQNQTLISLQAQKNIEAQFLGGLMSGKSVHEMALLIANSGSGMTSQQAEDLLLSVFARLFESGDLKTSDF